MDDSHQTRYILLQRACDLHDEQAWKELVGHYRGFILYILRQLGVDPNDLEDIMQQVLIALTRDLPRYEQSRGRFRTWFGSVIRNAAFVYFRQKKSTRSHIQVFGQNKRIDDMARSTELDQRIEKEWDTYIATQAMGRVREVFRGQAIEVFELSLDGHSAATIAERTGLTVSSVYTLRKRVKKRLYLEVRALASELEP